MLVFSSDNVSHDFKLDIEIYYSVSAESAASRFSGVTRPLRRTATGPEVPKFILAGHTQLTVDHFHESVKSHDLRTGKIFLCLGSPSQTLFLFPCFSVRYVTNSTRIFVFSRLTICFHTFMMLVNTYVCKMR